MDTMGVLVSYVCSTTGAWGSLHRFWLDWVCMLSAWQLVAMFELAVCSVVLLVWAVLAVHTLNQMH